MSDFLNNCQHGRLVSDCPTCFGRGHATSPPRPVTTTEPGTSFEGSAAARIRQLETAVMKARTALRRHSTQTHVPGQSSDCEVCLARKILEDVDR
jgi:hypothetical protein